MSRKLQDYCEICGSIYMLQNHHIMGSALRKKSDKYDECQITLCWHCHLSKNGVHQNRELDLKLKRKAQRELEEKYGHEWYMKEFGRNYL